MAVLYFSGNQVAFFAGIDSAGGNSTFTGVTAPFRAADVVEIVVPDRYIAANGDFLPDEVQFTRVTVIRDGVRHDFTVASGSRIKETGGNEIPEAGDTFFTTNDQVFPPRSGPFSGLKDGKMVFSTDSTFTTEKPTVIDRTKTQDLNGDGDVRDSGESPSGQFNTRAASTPPCYAPGTLIDTPAGPRRVEWLRPGDLVTTLDHGQQQIVWVGTWTQDLSRVPPTSRPVLLSAGALGPGLPQRDTIVSAQHRFLVGGAGHLQAIFPDERLVAAKVLARLPRVRHMAGRSRIVWHHFACARHEVVRANGCWTESLLLGPMVWRAQSLADRRRLEGVLDLAEEGSRLNAPPVRPCLPHRIAAVLIDRAGPTQRSAM